MALFSTLIGASVTVTAVTSGYIGLSTTVVAGLVLYPMIAEVATRLLQATIDRQDAAEASPDLPYYDARTYFG
ncbi:hypothetical protein [Phaeobacter gallaeciensis]|uniref:Uncharacterized protein n=1 Tax=Phaeobacter gallaeciensis TaxID=60890 RepID=A0AAD0EBI0_9RHOB|nr:hypothetical protein [Phaeobacter gallaeciensis]AHD08114.1 hypothetical protein Gal_00315 [Phaeobacter gallaeciensis DSM 26640]ATE91380.1 hypothetical protein PhaeoP11_00313 [Phaeobacter gallaeciensis]ATE95656.1 hypothetical protein PhaeoP73_00314 [Phaeobacter gallaeciensis]ATE99995.1 hypothetical protein PhaeoP75_00314 [Phaeobacter gallaeciensis]ATF04428.1 hypothetical protein PhaeoP63_00314 [Phaeobacter gallaeciensis]